MAALLWKDVLWPGTWTRPDGAALTVRPRDVYAAAVRGNLMLDRGLDIPVCWEHQPDTYPHPRTVELSAAVYRDPDRKADYARNTFSRVERFEVRPGEDGRPELFAGIQAGHLSADELERVKRAGKVSSRVDHEFTDARGAGTVYRGLTVGHVAVTPKPLEPRQGPFLMGGGPAKRTFYLGAIMADERDDETTTATADAEEAPPGTPADADNPGLLKSVLTSMAGLGISIPADTVTDLDSLNKALKVAVSVKTSADADSDRWGYEGSTEDEGSTRAGASPPMLMSQAEVARTHPTKVALDREELAGRIRVLFTRGQIDGPTRDAFLSDFRTFEMSYARDTGKPTDAGLVAAVSALERLVPRGTFLGKRPPKTTELSHAGDVRVVEPPADFTRTPDTEVDEEVRRTEERAAKRNKR